MWPLKAKDQRFNPLSRLPQASTASEKRREILKMSEMEFPTTLEWGLKNRFHLFKNKESKLRTAPGTYTGLWKQTPGGHKQNPVHTRTQEKGAMTLQETDPDLPMSVQELLMEVWVGGGLLQGQGHWVQHVTFWRRLKFFSLTPP